MNKTCLTSPEVTEGPYFLHGDMLRTRIDEGQAGVPLSAFFPFLPLVPTEAESARSQRSTLA